MATAAFLAAASCTQVGTDPEAIVAIAFESLPYPAVVAGDTLRDALGIVTPLRATALNSDGLPIPDAAVTFLSLAAGITITAEGLAISTDPTLTSAGLVAQAGRLQSRALTLFITQSPDSIALDGMTDTLRYVIPDGAANTSTGISTRVLSRSVTPPSNVRGWIVRYSVQYRGTDLAANDSTTAWLVDESGRRTAVDTTGTDGKALRRLRVIATALSSPADSFVVLATATNRGTSIAGSPVRAVVHVRPR